MKLNPVKTLGWFLTCHSIGQADRQSVSQSVSHLETEKWSHLHLYTCVFHVGMFSTIAPSFSQPTILPIYSS